MKVSGELHVLVVLPQRKEALEPSGQEAVKAPGSGRTLQIRETFFAPAGNRTPVVRSGAQSLCRLRTTASYLYPNIRTHRLRIVW
jgi:hypothetical protein